MNWLWSLWSPWWLLALVCVPTVAQAQAPAQLPVQGYLTDAAGVVLDGPVTMTFAIYDAESGGVAAFEEVQDVAVDGGYFTAYLGDVEPLALELFRDASSGLWLGTSVGGDPEMTPRMALGTTPWAAFAQYAGRASDADRVGGRTASDLAAPRWSDLRGVPPDLLDGDDDTTYSAGSGLTRSGTRFAVDPASVQSRVTGSCPAGQAIRSIDATGGVRCERDDDTTYTAGTGIALAGTTVSVRNWSDMARRDSAAGNQSFDSGTLFLDYGTNRVGIGDTTPTTRLDVAGTVAASSYGTRATQSDFLKLPASAWVARVEDDDYTLATSGYRYTGTPAMSGFAPVRVPDGATITSFTCFRYDNSAQDHTFVFTLYRRADTAAAATVMAQASGRSSGSSGAVRSASDTTIVTPIVNLAGNFYEAYFAFANTNPAANLNSSIRFYGCEIGYAWTVLTN